MRFCHLLVFVDEEKKPPLDIDWCIKSACPSKREGGREGSRSGGGAQKRLFLCFCDLIGLFCIYFSRRVRKEMCIIMKPGELYYLFYICYI